VGHNDVDIEPHQFRRQGRQLIIPSLGPAELDHNILAFGVAEVAQPGAKGSNARGMPRRGDKTQIPDMGDFRPLLRPRRQRPHRSRASEQRDELTTSHVSTLPHHWMGYCASQQDWQLDFRSGSNPVSLEVSKYFPICPRKRTSDLCVKEYTS
jgi:hypothetical protein